MAPATLPPDGPGRAERDGADPGLAPHQRHSGCRHAPEDCRTGRAWVRRGGAGRRAGRWK
eukprot:11876570-Alexandrium_andersonii.AAC.1